MDIGTSDGKGRIRGRACVRYAAINFFDIGGFSIRQLQRIAAGAVLADAAYQGKIGNGFAIGLSRGAFEGDIRNGNNIVIGLCCLPLRFMIGCQGSLTAY